MYYVLTFVGLCAVGYLMWRAFGPYVDDESEATPVVRHRTPPPIGPDDDPEFLHRLSRREKHDD